VLKFPINDRKSKNKGVEHELESWKKAYPEFKVFRKKWCGREALRMPHFAAVRPDERLHALDLVRTTLEANFCARGWFVKMWTGVTLDYTKRLEQRDPKPLYLTWVELSTTRLIMIVTPAGWILQLQN
jgi:hypothetical protein